MSHTVTTKVEYKNLEALSNSVVALGGQVLGEGKHQLYQHKDVEGYGFRLPGWSYPLVLTKTGELKYDDYNGHWGNPKDLDKLKGGYTLEQGKLTASSLGWQWENNPQGGIIIHHPEGGKLMLKPDGSIDAENFSGGACVAASSLFSNALGAVTGETLKDAYFEEKAQVQQVEGEAQ